MPAFPTKRIFSPMPHPSPLPRPRTLLLLLATLVSCLVFQVPARPAAAWVIKGSQTITFTSTAPGAAAVGGPTYTVTATASSGLPVTFTIDASATSVCSISGSTVSFIGGGMCVIDANQAGNANYNPAPAAQQAFAVAP